MDFSFLKSLACHVLNILKRSSSGSGRTIVMSRKELMGAWVKVMAVGIKRTQTPRTCWWVHNCQVAPLNEVGTPK